MLKNYVRKMEKERKQKINGEEKETILFSENDC